MFKIKNWNNFLWFSKELKVEKELQETGDLVFQAFS